jgi:GNAT superfamily N-acetyltransferase
LSTTDLWQELLMNAPATCAFVAQKITDPSVLERIYELRVACWRARGSAADGIASWTDAYDPDAQHWAILVGERPVAAARLTIHAQLCDLPDAYVCGDVLPALPSPIGSINRCVVDPEFQNRGLSRILDEVRISAAQRLGARCVVASVSQRHRARSLEKAGFKFVGGGLPYTHGFLKGIPNLVYLLRFDVSSASVETPSRFPPPEAGI